MFTFKNVLSIELRNSTKHVSPKDVASFTSDMKKIYKSPSYDAALKVLDSFEKPWIEKYPYAIKSWKIILMN